MMTTISSTHHQRTPLWVALAVGGALVVGGAIGVAINQSNDQSAQSQTQVSATTPRTPPWYPPSGPLKHYYNPNASTPRNLTFGSQ
jgi:hypothetical protein